MRHRRLSALSTNILEELACLDRKNGAHGNIDMCQAGVRAHCTFLFHGQWITIMKMNSELGELGMISKTQGN